MLVSHSHKLVFVHVQKTGGATVSRLLQENIPDVYQLRERHEFAIRGMEELEGWNEYFKFAFVRNPWDRLVSWYCMIRKSPNNFPLYRYMRDNSSTFEEFIHNCTDEIEVKKDVYYSFAYNQLDYVTDRNGDLLVDFIGRFENFEKDLVKVLSRLGIEPESLPYENRGSHGHYSSFYTPETEMIVRERFKKDIESFGYEFENIERYL